MKRRNLTAGIVGLLAFSLGIAILVYSFINARELFTKASMAASPSASGSSPATVDFGASALSLLIRIGALFIMVLVGSVVAGRGMQFYFAGEKPVKIED